MAVKTKKLNLNIDYSDLKLGEEEKKMSPQELTSAVIMNTILQYSQQIKGLQQNERKQVYVIDKAFDEAVKNKVNEVELDNNDIGFIRRVFRDTKLTPNDILKKVETMIDTINIL